MKIAFDHQIFSFQKYGGVSRYIFELANHLASADNGEVECRINSPFYINEYLRHANYRLQIRGIPLPAILGKERVCTKLNKILSPMMVSGWHPDIVHETYYSKSSIAPSRSRIVLTVHDMIHELYPGFFPAKDRTRKLKKTAVERADHIICVSENTRQDLICLLGVSPEKTTVVHHGLTLTQAEVVNSSVQQRPFLLYVGSRGGYKNFDRLLIAYASRLQLRDHYDLVAFGGGCFNTHELELISSLNLDEAKVRHIGGSDSVLVGLYKKAMVFVYPSLYEGFGIPLLEAMSFDCPVACSNTSSIPEVVGDAAIFFNPLDPDAIADALVGACTDGAMRSDLILRGRTRVANFSWRKCADQTLDVYRRILL